MEYSTIKCLPQDPRGATKSLLDNIINDIHPLLIKILQKSNSWAGDQEETPKIRDVYTLCLSQIKKCVLNLFEVFKVEFKSHTFLQETRQCNLERLSWCYNRLISIEKYLEKRELNISRGSEDSNNDSFNVTVMYFVNWIDHAFEVLDQLVEAVYKTDYKENEELCDKWKNDMVESISGLHVSIDELLLSAMTLCRYCLPNDQLIVKARCQVVLRETKALLSELINGDLSTTVKATSEALKLPVMPSNVNVMIEVLRDVLYALETNTNTALLTLVVHCFSSNTSPVNALKQHFAKDGKGCSCILQSTEDVTEDCLFVKEFDLFNERLLLIGSFAISCSSDHNRVLSLRSGLASLEALDPSLVPSLMTSPEGNHSMLLVKSWQQEVQEIRDSVFLIVDPAAFADKSKRMMHQKLLDALKDTTYNNQNVCSVINIGCVVLDFFNVYIELEPQALTHREKLSPLLADLNKVQLECKVVSNLLTTSEDIAYDVKTPTKKEATLDQLYKRLKLLYTLVSRINTLLQPKDNDDLFDEEEVQLKNVTHTVIKNGQTYINSPRKANSRSMFARSNVRSSTRNFPLSKLAKHLRAKNCSQLNFSVELDRLFNLSNEKGSEKGTFVKHNILLDRVRETSALYNFSPIKNRSSMRKLVLNRHLSEFAKGPVDGIADSVMVRESLMDENESLQLTEVLNQINDMTSILTTTSRAVFNETQPMEQTKNVLRINVNDHNTTVSNHVWHIPVNSCTNGTTLNETMITSNASDITQPSNVITLERINDLELVETKLNSLKTQFETSL